MGPIEIILIIGCVLVVGGVFGTWCYKKIKGLPTGDCGCCSHTKKKGNKLLKEYRKKYPHEEHCCCCQNDENQTEKHQCCCQKDEKSVQNHD